MVQNFLIVLFCLMLVGCSTKNPYLPDKPSIWDPQPSYVYEKDPIAPQEFLLGEETTPPYGWLLYCQDNPADLNCKEKQ